MQDLIFPFVGQSDLPEPDVQIMGTKGANLISMARLGLPVPPGFVVGVELGKRVASGDEALSDAHMDAIGVSISSIEQDLNRKFGDARAPLLISVRSGAAFSMPGMMDTVLNLGLNDQTVKGLAESAGDERFAWDTYRRFVHSYAHVVIGLDSEDFEDVLEELREDNLVDADADLSAENLKDCVRFFSDLIVEKTGEPFPQDPNVQLREALAAVFHSWNTARAKRFRDMQGVSHDGGTAAVIQAMVFGNRNENSCTGVYFTRNPSTGENKPYGEYMPNAQGEDVVSGIRTPMELTELDRARAMSDNASMETSMPEAFDTLLACGVKLEQHFQDMQEIEFTVEDGRLFLLQTRGGKRTPRAGLHIAVEMAEEGKITKRQAVKSCDMEAMEAMLVARVAPQDDAVFFTKGLPASPGAVSGNVVFSADQAVDARARGENTILVRSETDPKDVHGMDAAVGILTSRGGMTSHAAVVARGMGKPCITAAMTMKIDVANQSCTCAGKTVAAGDVLTIDGTAGSVHLGEQPITLPEPDGELATLLQWRKEEGL